MPRRYADYPMQFADFNAVASVAGFAFGLAQVYFFFAVVLPCMRHKGEPAPQRPWNDPDGKGAEGLEWEVPSPAPFHTFEVPPRLDVTATKVLDARVHTGLHGTGLHMPPPQEQPDGGFR
jgi:cytochrome c oxidase subunit I